MQFKTAFFIIAFSLGSLFSLGQNRVDSLKNKLTETLADSAQLTLLIDIAMEYVYTDIDSLFHFGEKAIEICNRNNKIWEKGLIIQYYAKSHGFNGNNKEALRLLDSAMLIYKEIDSNQKLASCLNDKGIVYWYQEEYDSAKYYINKALAINIHVRNKSAIALNLINLGNIHAQKDEYSKAITYYKSAQKVFVDIGDQYSTCTCLINLANVHILLENYDDAEEYALTCLKIANKNNFKEDIANCINTLGTVVLERDIDYDSALVLFKEAIDIAKNIGDAYGVPSYMSGLASVYEKKEEYTIAAKLHKEIIELSNNLDDKYTALSSYLNLGDISYKLNKIEEAERYYNHSLKIAYEIESKENIHLSSLGLAKLHNAKNNFKKAYNYGEIAYKYRDSVLNQEKIKDITRVEMQYDFDRIREIERLEKAKQDEIFILKIETQRKISFFLILGLVILVILLVIALRYYNQKRKAHNYLLEKNEVIMQQKAEIEAQTDNLAEANIEISKQKEKLELAHKHIKDSILYSKNIQSSAIGDENILKENIKEYFVYWKPLDIVSGDFYWVRKLNNKLVVAVADCTGHGVPGALLSILGTSLLNEVLGRRNIESAATALGKLRMLFKSSLKQTYSGRLAKDGMDITLCIIDFENYSMQFAGAYQSLVIKRSNSNNGDPLLVIKGDRQPISAHPIEFEFTNHELQLYPDDQLYLFTDGLLDQFGGSKNKKFGKNRFYKLIESISDNCMEEQKEILGKVYEEWTENKYPQIDDILLLGMKM